MLIYIFSVLSIIIVYILQTTLNTKEYKNKWEQFFDNVKLPLIVLCVIIISYNLCNKVDIENVIISVSSTTPDILNQKVSLNLPNF